MRRLGLQVVWWWPEWVGLGRYWWEGNWARIYRWSLNLGFVEVRRWAPVGASARPGGAAVDLNEMLGRITLKARVANVRLVGRRRFYWRMRVGLGVIRLGARVCGIGFEEVGVDMDEMGYE